MTKSATFTDESDVLSPQDMPQTDRSHCAEAAHPILAPQHRALSHLETVTALAFRRLFVLHMAGNCFVTRPKSNPRYHRRTPNRPTNPVAFAAIKSSC